jgi:hypothetical protein
MHSRKGHGRGASSRGASRLANHRSFFFFLEEVYTQQEGRAHSHRLHPGDAARPALMNC